MDSVAVLGQRQSSLLCGPGYAGGWTAGDIPEDTATLQVTEDSPAWRVLLCACEQTRGHVRGPAGWGSGTRLGGTCRGWEL